MKALFLICVPFSVSLLGSQIFRAAEAEDRVGDKVEQEQADTEAGALAEGLCQLDAGVDHHKGDQNAQDREQAHAVAQRDLAEIIDIQEGDQAVPAGNACLRKDLPHAGNDKNDQNQRNDAGDGAAGLIRIAVAFHIKTSFLL